MIPSGTTNRIKVVTTQNGTQSIETISPIFTLYNHWISKPTIISPTLNEIINETVTISWNK